MASVVISGDTSGAITISAPAVAGTNTLTLPVATDTLVGKTTTDTLTNKTLTSPTLTTPALGTPASGVLTSCTGINYDGYKNRIINGAMAISQRGTSFVSPTGAYTIDRWEMEENTDGTVTVTQDTDAPTGFSFSQKLTVTSADASLAATQDLIVGQYIEGFNTADLVFGSASAATVTLSFWVKSSLTGTFGGALQNSARTRSYPFTYAISSASTWEQKTVTIAGDTSGTWIGATNGIGLRVYFGLGVGSTYSGTAGAWAATNYYSATGAVSVIGTNSATWAVTGVQLEKGSTATSFDYRPIGTELQLCQRYFERSYNIGTATGTALVGGIVGFNTPLTAASDIPTNILFKVTKRDTPTMTVYNAVSGASGTAYRTSDAAAVTVSSLNYIGTNGVGMFTLASGSANNYLIQFTASSEL